MIAIRRSREERVAESTPVRTPPGVASPLPSAPAATLSLPEVWLKYVLPKMRMENAPSSISDNVTTLKCWIDVFSSGNAKEKESAQQSLMERAKLAENSARSIGPGAVDKSPGVHLVNEETLRQFCSQLRRRKMSAGTVKKYLAGVMKVLREARAKRLISELPEKPKIIVTTPRALPATPGEVRALYAAVGSVGWPRIGDRSPGDFWRFVILATWTYGWRTQDIVSIHRRSILGLEWRSIKRVADVGVGVDNDCGWIEFSPRKTTRTRPQMRLWPISRAFHAELDLWRGMDCQRVIPNPCSKHAYLTTWRKLRENAGVAPDVFLSKRNSTDDPARSIRKACSNHWDRLKGARAGLGRYVLANEGGGTNVVHYTDVLPDLVKWIDNITLPWS